MLRIILICAICCITATQAQSAKVDEEGALISFVFLDGEVNGSISDFVFDGKIDLDDMTNSLLKGSVKTKTLDTNNWLRSRHLRSSKYFASKDHPRLKFESQSIKSNGDQFKVEGELTIKGISRSITLDMVTEDGQLILTGMMNTLDFDIEIYEERERNQVRLNLVLPLIKN